MKKVIITIFAALYVTAAFGQEKTKLAVYVQGSAGDEEKKVVSSQIISTIVKSNKYAAVERTADFLAELRRESGYQYSGNVDDGQLIKLGKQFGVGKICVADVIKSGTDYDSYYKRYRSYDYSVAVRMIDIETGLVISAAGSYDKMSASYHQDVELETLISAANNVATKLLQNVTTTADKQKMAIYVTKNSDSYKAKCVSSQLTENITNMGAFITVDRTSDFLAEVKYQNSGNVDDTQLSRLGKQFGVNLVCVIDITNVGNGTYTTVRIIDVETSVIMATSEKKGWGRREQVWEEEYEKTNAKYQGSKYYVDIFRKNLDEITSELMQPLVQALPCIKKDQTITNEYNKCCEKLTNVNGVCRDNLWLKDFLGIETNAKDLAVRQGTIVESKCKTCPESWRMPTKAEFEKMLRIKETLNFIKNRMYVTSDFIIETVYDKKSKSTINYYKYYVWSASGFSLKTIYYQSYPKKGKTPPPYYYEYENLYIRCVKD